jgi:hypothetical protein
VYAANGKFLTRVTFKDGINTSTKTVNTTGVGNSQIKTFDETLQEVTVTSVIKSTTYYFIYIVPGISNQELVPVDPGLGGSGGGGSSNNQTKDIDTIIYELDSFPCAENLLKSPPINANCVEINSLIKNTFNLNSDIKLTYKVDNSLTLSNLLNGYTNSPSLSYGMYRQNIFLNSGVLSNSTQEFIFATMLHEGVHAVLDFWNNKYRKWCNDHNDPEGIDSFQLKQMFPIFWDYKRDLSPTELAGHNQMADIYINEFKSNLFALNPYLNNDMATALAWKGLQESTAWKNRSDTNHLTLLIHIARRDTLASDYLIYGMSKCN